MRMINGLKAGVVTVASILGSQAALAAEIRLVDGYHGPCQAVLTGPIEAGDVDRLRAVLPGDGTDAGYATTPVTLCLNSPGGSFTEGLALARYLARTGIGTHVAAGDRCLSACAYAFLGGTTLWFEDELHGFQSRSIHPLAELGIHAPSLELAPGQYTERQVDRAYDIALTATTEIIAQRGELRISEDFALELLSYRGADMMMIDTPERVADLGVDVVGLRALPDRISDARLTSLCHRYAPGTDPRSFEGARASSWHNAWIMDLPPGERGEARRAYLASGFEEGMVWWNVCIIGWLTDRLAPESSSLTLLNIGPYQIESDRGSVDNPQPPTRQALLDQIAALQPQPWPTGLPAVLAAAPGARLADLGRASLGTEARIAHGSCDATVPRYRVQNVQQFSNLRASPGFDGAVRREVPLNGRVYPAFDGMPHTAILSSGCRNACTVSGSGALRPEALLRMQSCGWSNDLWWRVRTEDGTEGWISARFLARD